MAKQFALIAFSLLLVSVVGSAQDAKDWHTFSLLGRVKSVRLSKAKFSIENGTPVEGRPVAWEQTDFDEQGYYTDLIGLENGSKRPWRNKHDSLGRIVERSEQGSSEKTIFRYLPGQVEVTTQLSDGHVLDKRIYHYDAKGNEILSEYFLIDEDLGKRLLEPPAKTVSKYDDHGLLIEQSSFDRDGSPYGVFLGQVKFTHKYDEKSRPIESSSYKADGSVVNTWYRKYDGTGRLIEVSSTKSNRIVYSDFDARGNWLKSVIYKKTEKKGQIPSFEPIEAEYRAIEYY